MNSLPHNFHKLALVLSTAVMLAACASNPGAPDGSVAVRNKLSQLQQDAQLASLAPVEIQEAEQAVIAAEKPQKDEALGKHLVLLADRKVDIASAWAQSRLYEEQREDLARESEQARLDSRTREADQARRDTAIARDATTVARSQAATARGDAAEARGDAAAARSQTDIAQDEAANARSQAAISRNQTDIARNDAEVAQGQAASARVDASAAQDQAAIARNQAAVARRDNAATQQENADLELQIAALNGRATDRGLVVTLGDVLFATGESTIQGGNTSNLDQLAVFLNRYTDRSVTIEGHTDDIGTSASNRALSQRRADAVREYLVAQGVGQMRFVATGMGEARPVASNDSATGRQQNRRVEVIIADAR